MKINKVEGALKPFIPQIVDMREPLVDDLVTAEVMSGKNQGYEFLSSVISRCCTFDGQTVPPEDVKRLRMIDFLGLTDALGLNGRETSQSGSFTSLEKESGEKKE
jgi:hypothetical protein